MPSVRFLLTLLLTTALAFSQQRNFVACPLVRDTKVAPCFLAEYEGETYFLGTQLDAAAGFRLPQLKHEVLVEGRVAPGPRVCGGIPLKPLSISVLKEVNLACNILLPPEPGIEAPGVEAPPASRPAPPSARPPSFVILYAFNDDSLDTLGTQVLTASAEYAKRTRASAVKVSGYRATTILSNGTRLVENAGLAEKRTQNVAALLRGFGLSTVTVESNSEPEPGDGTTDPSRRRVTILVIP